MEKITILLADDHLLIRDAWSFMLGAEERFQVIGAASSGDEAIAMALKYKPNIILMDLNMGETSGFDATERILKELPATKIIIVSMHAIPVYAKRLFKAGVKGYVTKNSDKDEFLQAIHEVYNGKTYICREIKEIVSQREFEGDDTPDINSLSTRELEVVKFIKEGLSSKEISERLGLSLKTIEVHRYNILKKLNLKNSALLVNYMNLHGF